MGVQICLLLCLSFLLIIDIYGHGYYHSGYYPAGSALSVPTFGSCRSDSCDCHSLYSLTRHRCGAWLYLSRQWYNMCTTRVHCSTPTRHCCQVTSWTVCDKSCGGGSQKRTVKCADRVGGHPNTCATINSEETRSCNAHACPAPTTCTTTTPFINEIHYHPSTGSTEFIEVAGLAGADLSGYTLILYSENDGGVYGAEPLGTLSNDGSSAIGFFSVTYPTNGVQNGPDGIALVDNTGTVLQFLSYEGSFTATNGHAVGTTSVDIGVSQISSANSLQLQGSGCDSADFTWVDSSSPTKDAINDSQTFAP